MAEIRLEHVTKQFADGTHAVRDASFTVHDGERFILVGPSGCGKSTLLNLIVGLEEPTSGEIRVDGRSMQGVDPKDRDMAMVFQSYALYPHMTVGENLAFPLRLAGLPRPEITARVEETARLLAISDLLGRKPESLSGGQRQRVAMGRAIVRRPKVFLLDEPLSNLDAQLRAQMRAELARLQHRLGTTTIYVTHDQTEAMTLGDRVAILRRGDIQQVATPRDLYARPANLFVAGFIGTPPMNVLPARLAADRLVLPMAELTLDAAERGRLPSGDGPVVVGIRPEHLVPARPGEAAGAAVFGGTAELVEWLGAELFVHLDAGCRPLEPPPALSQATATWSPAQNGSERVRLIARLDPAEPVGEGQRLSLAIGVDRIHLFDGETGLRIETGPGRRAA
ncbi:MAG: ABC transporter ATP-binding protein [Chromatiaceae bacterium]